MHDNFDDNWFDEFDDDADGYGDNEYISDLASLNEFYESVKANPVIFDLDSLEDYISLALELGEFEIGLELADTYLKFSSYDSEMWQKKGLFHYHLEEFEEAEKALLKAYTLNPIDIETILNLASVYSKLENQEQELYYLKLANDLYPENRDAKMHLIYHYENNDIKKAIELLYEMLEDEPSN
ncbi:MAG: tetratricopeptide repeat protein, partial [Ignavibacteria bacterium]